jgi:uncharacterized damage-inducible protein DinB
MSAPDHGTSFVAETVAGFHALKDQADRALAQVSDDAFFARLDDGSNSLAVLVAHMAGNALSRWTDFLTTDGEKPTRNRDAEFELDSRLTRPDLMRQWEAGWRAVFAAVEPLTSADLDRSVTIRGERHSVMQAILRQVRHYAYHVGQIVQLAKHYRGADWQTLSIPKGQSRQYDRALRS